MRNLKTADTTKLKKNWKDNDKSKDKALNVDIRKIYTSENGLVKEAVAILRLKYKKWQKPPSRICRWLDCSKKLLHEQSWKNH